MKKIFTLGVGFMASLVSFARIAPGSLTVTAEGNAQIQVMVDGYTQSSHNAVEFDNLQTGFHEVKIYRMADRHFGPFPFGHDMNYRLVYDGTVNIKPMFATTIALNRFGRSQVTEEPIRRGYGDWDGDYRNDGRDNREYRYGDRDYHNRDRNYRHNDEECDNDNGYNDESRVISTQDFFAAQRVMDRENDNGRLLYGKTLVNDNYLYAEQVKELARFFSFDSYRLEFVKYAYGKTIDKNNFSVVASAFTSAGGRNQVLAFMNDYRY